MNNSLKPNDEETEEECAARLRKISEEVKADIKAGRYKGGQVHEHIRGRSKTELQESHLKGSLTGRWSSDGSYLEELVKAYSGHEATEFFRELFATPIPERRSPEKKALDFLHMYGSNSILMLADECHHVRPEDFWVGRRERFDWPVPAAFDRLDPKPEPDWKRTKFVSGSAFTPSEALRKKRREERKKKKGHKK